MSETWLRGREYLEITPKQFEIRVLTWLKNCHQTLNDFTVIHSNVVHGDSGEYEIDVHIEFTIFNEAKITVIVECKRHRNPVKRDVVMLLEGKLRDTGAHKGMVFSTSGFQRGPIEYATQRGIALIDVAGGASNYHVRAEGMADIAPPPWVDIPDYIGWFQTSSDGSSVSNSMISDDRYDPLIGWLSANAGGPC
jgi:restriction system protein